MNETRRKAYSPREKEEIFNSEFLPQIESLYNSAYHLTYDEDDSKDLVQEAYLRAYRYIEFYENQTNARAWLFRILRNAFINDLRKKNKRAYNVEYHKIESDYLTSDVGRELSEDLRLTIVNEMIGDELSGALNSLNANFRMVIILYCLKGFKYSEIAKILDIPIGTVRSRLHKAKNKLKEILSEYGKEMGYL